MKSSEYWKKRFELLEKASNAYGISAYKKIEPVFEQAAREIQKEIEAWYGRLAKNNSVSMQEARKLLSANELKEFHWDVNEYIKYGRENVINQQWMKELENASAKFHISRLEALKIRTQQVAEKAFGNELDYVDKMARRVYSENYYHSIFEMQKGFHIGFEIGQIDERKLNKLIAKPWTADGRNFSDRIWQQKAQLVDELHTQLTRNCLLGKAPDDAINAISKKFNVTKSQAGRLVMTEEAYFHALAQKDAYKELDVEEYKILATLDNKTSEICREMDGKRFPMSEYEPGRTAPPFHCWCRSTTVPYDEDFEGIGERAARDTDGKGYYVPSDMTYKEWEREYVINRADQNSNKTVANRSDNVIIKPTDDKEVKDVHYIGKIDKEIYKCVTDDIVTDEIIITYKQIEHIKTRHPNDYERFSDYFKEIVSKPDYIIEANKPNSALVLKKIDIENEQFKTVVRIATSDDNPSIKNSIITFMKIDDKEWNRILRNKKILYKSE